METEAASAFLRLRHPVNFEGSSACQRGCPGARPLQIGIVLVLLGAGFLLLRSRQSRDGCPDAVLGIEP